MFASNRIYYLNTSQFSDRDKWQSEKNDLSNDVCFVMYYLQYNVEYNKNRYNSNKTANNNNYNYQ